MTGYKTLSTQSATVKPATTHERKTVRMNVIEDLAGMAAGTEMPALIWGNTDRATVAAEALWIFARRTGLDGCGEEAFTTIQDLIANLMHLCEQEGITDEERTFTNMICMAEMHYQAERDEEQN